MFVRFRSALAFALLAAPLAASAQNVTGLSNWSLVIDPGHSQTENQGAYGYSEAEKTLAVGLELRRLLTTYTDIRAVYLTRTTSSEVVSLSQRTDFANASGGAYFHSIHSNAADASARSGFVLWAQMPDLSEPSAYSGGRAMAKRMGPTVGRAMRIPLSGTGDYGECAFYGVSTCGSGAKGSRNYVQRNSYMPSTLSEMGFHTNPTQNLRNMNADWKRMEARAFFWAILKHFNIPRPAGRFLTGIVSDVESGLPVNGATVEYAGKSYTTDTYASLFNRYSTDPNELRNGYYYLEDVATGPNPVNVSAPGYASKSVSVTPADTFFTFVDVPLVSSAPLTVVSSTPAANASGVRPTDPISVTFSRPVAPATAQAAVTITPLGGGAALAGTIAWSNGNRTLVFTPSQMLEAYASYVLTVAGTTASPYGYALDGNTDGTPGDAFTLPFATGSNDSAAPSYVERYVASDSTGAMLRPLLALKMSELVMPASRPASLFTLVNEATSFLVGLRVAAYDVGDQTVITLAPRTALAPNTTYRLVVAPGMKDLMGNAITAEERFVFTTGRLQEGISIVDAFDDDVSARWWEPLQSGSTTGVVADSTVRQWADLQSPLLYDTGKSLAVKYGFQSTSPGLLREYLNSGTPKTVRFDTTYTLMVSVFGDGTGTRLRFAVDDNCPASQSTCSAKEVSPWTSVTWKGWRTVQWDLGGTPPQEEWLSTSNLQLEGSLRFDSFQLAPPVGASAPVFGRIAFDDLRLVKTTAVAGEDEGAFESDGLALAAPSPNPTARIARLRYALPDARPVRLAVFDVTGREVAVLVDETRAAGSHVAEWDAAAAAPGMYLVRLVAGSEQRTATVVVQR